jgi:hypothetical protein
MFHDSLHMSIVVLFARHGLQTGGLHSSATGDVTMLEDVDLRHIHLKH